MPIDKVEEANRVREKLKIVTEQFERAMRERGFDPQQAENVPLTESLANLHREQTNLRLKLNDLTLEREAS